MNLPADDRTGQGAGIADTRAAESGQADARAAESGRVEVGGVEVDSAESGHGAQLVEAGAAGANGATDGSGAGADDAEVTRRADARSLATRRILDEVFGDVLPTVTRDELDDGSDRSGGGRDQWYQDNRPPHHG